MVVDALSTKYSIPVEKSRYQARFGQGSILGQDVILVKPQAYMNLSGPPILDLARHFGILGRQMLIIHDDIDLAFGRLKIQEKGGSGGHKGVSSIIDAFCDKEFVRLRLGVGRSADGADVVAHVLTEFTSREKEVLESFITFARDAAITILCKGAKEGMNRFNKSIV
jgi:PTH1 family peptidyl-tRNA hydrolase